MPYFQSNTFVGCYNKKLLHSMENLPDVFYYNYNVLHSCNYKDIDGIYIIAFDKLFALIN